MEWTKTEVKLKTLPFEPGAVTATANPSDRWEPSGDRLAAVRVCFSLSGLPEDALFLELDPKASEVVWADGSRGTIREIWSQYVSKEGSGVDVLTTVPPAEPNISTVRIALDVHRPTLIQRSEAVVGIDEAAAFDFGVIGAKWTLSSDLRVTAFTFGRYRKALTPLFDRGLYPTRLVRLTDKDGKPLQEWGGGGAGSMTITHWGTGFEQPLTPPLHVTVDVPQETTTSRVVVNLKDIHPRR